jgi:DNA-binding transcriptional MerR regulator
VSDDGWYSIGELAERTGLPVRTIRFYSDQGVVPATGRSAAGHRRYDVHGLARLDLVRTLRELGLPLSTIRAVLDDELSLPQVAAAHAQALDTQIDALRSGAPSCAQSPSTTPPPRRRQLSCTSSPR